LQIWLVNQQNIRVRAIDRGGYDRTRSQSKGDTEIGNDVWIDDDVTMMPGVRTGDGAIIAAKSVAIEYQNRSETLTIDPIFSDRLV
jgi:acetyltransferase-like isoleucine patch superfamily enzyme